MSFTDIQFAKSIETMEFKVQSAFERIESAIEIGERSIIERAIKLELKQLFMDGMGERGRVSDAIADEAKRSVEGN